jgi:two-component system, cell cycle sensor histidine kinase and response regulator CckA
LLGIQPIVAELEGPGLRTSWKVQRSKRRCFWILTAATIVPLVVASAVSGLYLWHLIPATPEGTAVTLVGLAGLSGIAATAYNSTNAALARRLEMLCRALDSSPTAHLITVPGERLGYANVAFDRLFPGSAKSPLDRIEQELGAVQDAAARFRRLRGRAATGAQAATMLSLSKVPGGGAEHFKISVRPIAGYTGCSLWIIEGIIEPRTLEAGCDSNELSDLLDNAPVGFYSIDSAGSFRYVNRTLARWLGSTRLEILAGGVRLGDFLASPPSDGVPVFEPFAAHGTDTRRGEILLKTRDNHAIPAWIVQNVVGSGPDQHTRSVVCDLTPDSGLKAELRLSERFLRCFANAPVGIAFLDHLGTFEEANQAVGELFGAEPETLRGQNLIGLLNEQDRERTAAKLAAAADGRVDPEPIEVRPRAPSDKAIMLYLSRLDDAADAASLPRMRPGNDPQVGLTLHFIDVTEQKKLKIQFAQSQKMQAVGQLAGGVAHDFNNLLTAMIGFCDLLLLRSPPGDPSFADIMQIKQNANRAANLVRQLLAFSRQQTLQPRVLNITDVLYELRHLLERLIGENIKLDVVHGRDLGLAKVDQGQLEQVIINLAVNARDAMPGGGTLTIRTANIRQNQELRREHEVMPAGDYLLIEVADTGVGIPKKNLARVFDPFFSTKELGSGTGLGLSTVYGIVKQTGGFIFVSSDPGRGAAFQIYLPQYQAAELVLPVRADRAEMATAKDLTGRGTIMLVEDDDPVRIFGARALRNKGYKVIEAKSGEAALDLIRNAAEEIDLLITDVVMPRMDGPSLVREVREIHPEMKVIFISGYTEDAFRQHLDGDSGIDFLPKPFSLKQLAVKVRDVIGIRLA